MLSGVGGCPRFADEPNGGPAKSGGGPKMPMTTLLQAMVVLACLNVVGSALAQDESGDGAAAVSNADRAAPHPEQPLDGEASLEPVACGADGLTRAGVLCAAAPVAGSQEPADPFATVSWEGSGYDTPGGSPGGEGRSPKKVGC